MQGEEFQEGRKMPLHIFNVEIGFQKELQKAKIKKFSYSYSLQIMLSSLLKKQKV